MKLDPTAAPPIPRELLGQVLRELEFDRILERVAASARSPQAREQIQSWLPDFDFGRAERLAELTEELIRARQERMDYRELGLEKLAGQERVVRRLSAGEVLEREEFGLLRDLTELTAQVMRFREEVGRLGLRRLSGLLSRLDPLDELRRELQRVFSPELEVRDEASPRLAEIRRERARLERRVAARLEQLAAEVPEAAVVVRADRFALRLPRPAAQRLSARILEVAGGGSLLVVEPEEVFADNNRRVELTSEERREVSRILAHLSQLAYHHREGVEGNLSLLVELDVAQAKAHFAESATHAVRAHFVDQPVVEIDRGVLPLIEEFVPETVEVPAHYEGVVISGVNAGGKTVLLKLIGNLFLLALMGSLVPARGARFGRFAGLFADILEEHSIATRLSAFTSHLDFLTKLIDWMERRSDPSAQVPLVLMDEIGTGTEPSEGAALARAVITYLIERGVKLFVTTHYESLKALGVSHPRVLNLSMEFDREKLRPTFRVLTGIPGASYALEIARQYGLPEEVVRRAREEWKQEGRRLAEVIAELEKVRLRLDRTRREAEIEQRKARTRAKELEQELKRLREKRQKLSRQLERSLVSAQKELERRLREMVAERSERQKLARRLAEERSRLTRELARPLEEAVETRPPAPGEDEQGWQPRPGDQVRVRERDLYGVVRSVDQRGVEVKLGRLLIRLRPEELEPVEEVPSGPRPEEGERLDRAIAQASEELGRSFDRVDLHGMTRDEAARALDEFLDRCVLRGVEVVHIMHGVGSGVLRDFVRHYLRQHPAVKSFRNATLEEGGTGVTVAELH